MLGERLSMLVADRPVAVLSGPNMAEEIAVGLPSAAVVASEDEELAAELQDAINSTVFRVYVNSDLAGVELCAAAKNVIALAAGGVDGLRLGDNGKAALITRGLAEMARLGEAYGARQEWDSAIRDFSQVVRLQPDSAHAFSDRAGMYLLARQPDNAVQDFTDVNRKPPDFRRFR